MANPRGLNPNWAMKETFLGEPFVQSKAKKRVTATPKERIYVWEHPEMYGQTCHICNGRITKLSDLEFDHKLAFSKGGKKMALSHRDCNRMKSNKSLNHIQRKLGFKSSRKTRKDKGKKKRVVSSYNILTGKVKFDKIKLDSFNGF